MKKILFCATWLVFLEVSWGAPENQPVKVDEVCRQAAKVRLPSQDPPDAAVANTLANCDAQALYYGYAGNPDYIKARQCAYLKQDYGVLTMVYANGKGAARNWDLAIHFACLAGFAPAEVDSRVNHLKELQEKQVKSTDFDICDDITSGYMMGVCADKQEKLQALQRQRRLAALTAVWNTEQKSAFVQLQKAAETFFEIRSENEVDLSGTGRAAFIIEERAALENDFLDSLEMLEKQKLPAYTTDQYRSADAQLNNIYNQIQKNTDFSIGTIDRSSVKKTQKAWLKYRDAWVAFGGQQYPETSPDSWKTWLTKKRIEMLNNLSS